MNWGVISRNVGIALISCAVFMFLSALVAALDGFDTSFSPLLLSAIVTMMAGIFPLIFVRRHKDINTREGLAILLIAWILSCIFSMLPFVLWGGEFTLVNGDHSIDRYEPEQLAYLHQTLAETDIQTSYNGNPQMKNAFYVSHTAAE